MSDTMTTLTDKRCAEIARKVVNQALKHPTAVEVKISVATLLIGLEHELAKAMKQHADD